MRLACLSACALLAAALPARAADDAGKPPLSQQERFAACAHDSKGLHGAERQRFMGDCLKGGAQGQGAREPRKVATGGGQQNRMRSCNAEAREKGLHGEERRAFMSACLRG